MKPGDPQGIVLSELARAIAATTEPTEIYGAISEAAGCLLGAKIARVWLNEPGAGILRAVGSFGVPRDIEAALLDTVTVPHGAGIPGRVAVARAPEFIADAQDDTRWINARFIQALDIHAYAGLPLLADDTTVGVLSILFGSPRAFSEDDMALASWLADYAAITVRLAQAYDERRRAETQRAVIALANSVAHEINGPLTVVIGRLALVEGRGDPEVVKDVQRARAAAERLTEIVHRLQRITRLEMFRHTEPTLPPMLDLWRSSSD